MRGFATLCLVGGDEPVAGLAADDEWLLPQVSGTRSTKAAIVLDIVVFVVPALCVLVVGLLAGRVVTDRASQRRANSVSSSPA